MRVLPPDIGLFLTKYLRTEFPDADVVENEPADLELPLAKPLIVVRDDSGPRETVVTFNRTVGVSVMAGSPEYPTPAINLARQVAGVLFDDAIALVPGSPIASVDPAGCNGPYAVPEQLSVAKQYLTADYVTVGEWNG